MSDIYNYQSLGDKLSSSGMPTAGQLKQIADAHTKVVINLALTTSPEALPNEAALVESLGMEYIHIPVEWNAPTTQNLQDFFAAMDTHADMKIHVHCQANYRASAFIMLYRILRRGWKTEEAAQAMERIWNPDDFPIWQKFIDDQLAGRA